jgi:hypothetical protein
LKEGISLERAAASLGTEVSTLSETAAALTPYLELADGRMRLTLDGFLMSTSVLGELLELRGGARAS